MQRRLYRALLCLYPFGFRERFAEEMLWIFDEASAGDVTFPIFWDTFLSVIRQRAVPLMTWKVAATLIAGTLEMAIFLFLADPFAKVPAVELNPAGFIGDWTGRTQPSTLAGRMELTLTRSGGAWAGEFRIQGSHGEMRKAPAEDIQINGSMLQFRIKGNQADLKFKGQLIGTRLAGRLERSQAP